MTFPEPHSSPIDCLIDFPEETKPLDEEEDRDLFPADESPDEEDL